MLKNATVNPRLLQANLISLISLSCQAVGTNNMMTFLGTLTQAIRNFAKGLESWLTGVMRRQ